MFLSNAAVGAAFAQETGENTRQSGVAAVVSALAAEQTIRVTLGREIPLEGELLPGPENALRLRSHERVLDIPFERIDSLWTRQARTRQGAFVGGVIGATAGALLTWAASAAICDASSCDPPPATTWALMVGGGAAIGTGVGAVVGSSSFHWKILFPSDP
jgi:hypothetical protein